MPGQTATAAAGQHACASTTFELRPPGWIESSIADRFREAVAHHPDCLAVGDADRPLTYAELDRWSNGIAAAVLARSDAGTEPVAIAFPQGAACTAAILGLLKAARPYLPLDVNDPVERLRDLAGDAGSRLVLTDRGSTGWARGLECDVLCVDDVEPGGGVVHPVGPDDIAYVFFTSGSTGRPKGVFDNHRNVLHNVLRYTNSLHIGPAERLSLIQSPSFSGTVSTLFAALLNGAAVFPFRLADEGLNRLAAWLEVEHITMLHSVPAIFRSVASGDRRFPSVHTVRLEGDRASGLDAELHTRHFCPGSRLVNGLGTTETGLVSQLFLRHGETADEAILPVGYPVRDMGVAVLGDDGAELEPGQTGEIAVYSPYLALGYWGAPELTARAFARTAARGGRVYRTGDVGRLRDDGCLEYLGRRDAQLKVLGRRVDPAEVEAELLRLEEIREALVATAPGRRGEGRLIAYVVPAPGASADTRALRCRLSARLPAALVPSSFVVLEALPLGPNRKVDRGALPAAPPSGHGRPPRDELERELRAIWERVLETDVGVDDSFFDLGGDSLAAAEILAELERATGVALSPSALVAAPTVEGLADRVRGADATAPGRVAVMRDGGRSAPLVLVHGQDGHALKYAGLVHGLPGDRPVWALEASDESDLSIEMLAARHLRALRAARPRGPYLLAGHCYGAVVAFELAHRLRDAGEEVSLLALLAVSPADFPTLLDPVSVTRWRHAHGPRARTLTHLRRARSLPRNERATYLAARGRNLWRRVLARVRTPTIARDRAGAARHAFARYRPAPYPADALVVLAQQSAMTYTGDPARVWAPLAEGRVDVTVLPGGDDAMLEQPVVLELGNELQRALAELG